MRLGIIGGKREPPHLPTQTTPPNTGQTRYHPKCPPTPSADISPSPSKQVNPPSQWDGPLPLALPGSHLCPHFSQQPLRGPGEAHGSLYQDPCSRSPRPRAFTQCLFDNKMGKFFFLNKGSLLNSILT